MVKFLKNIFKAMLAFMLGAFGAVIGVLILILVFAYITTSGSASQIYINENSWLLLDYSGELTENPDKGGDSPFMGGNRIAHYYKLIDAIDAAKFDDRIKGLVINGDLTFYSTVHIWELIEAIKDFKKGGKKVYAWFSNGYNNNYLLSSVADEIYIANTKSASLTLKGYSLTLPYYKDLFDKSGIEFNVVHIGEYKGTGENYIKNSMSGELKSSYKRVFDDLYKKKLTLLAKNRGLTYEYLDNLYKTGKTIFMEPSDAIEYKLVDKQLNYNEMMVNISGKEKYNTVSILQYMKSFKPNQKRNKIAVVYAEGVITNYFTGNSGFGEDMIGAKSLNSLLRDLKNDNNIKAIVLRVNSPGGSALGSELMLSELKKLNEVKPVYVSHGGVAASGGYYISLGGKKIFTSPFTITGSIGVVSMMMNYEGLAEKVGVNYETLKKNRFDDLFNPTRELMDDEKEILKRSMKHIYEEFTGRVISEREGIDKNNIQELAQGRIWSGDQAIKNNLADEIATLNGVITYAAKEADLDTYSVESYPKPVPFIEKLMEMTQISSFIDKEIKNNDFTKEMYNLYLHYKYNKTDASYFFPYYDEFE